MTHASLLSGQLLYVWVTFYLSMVGSIMDASLGLLEEFFTLNRAR